MDEQISLFMDITSVSDPTVASNFLEMSGGDLSTAVGLYYEHGAGAGTSSTSNNNNNDGNNTTSGAVEEDDFEMANRLQREMYEQQNNDEVRQPIMPTHDTLLPQEYGFGGIPGMGMGMGMGAGAEGGMFGRSQRSVFNQVGGDGVVVLDSDDDDDEEEGDDLEEDDDLTGNYDLNGGAVRSRPKMTSTQKRLASIFRPPWDIINKIDLDTAKKVAREANKWILVNIQDVTDFRCQCLNRDFWSSRQIKDLVRENFVFLQYHNDSPSGEMYRNLYPFGEEYPHIAILDPMTGERMMMWNTNPEIHKFIEQVVDFLTRYSADGATAKVAPTSVGLTKNNAIDLEEEEEEEEEDNDNSVEHIVSSSDDEDEADDEPIAVTAREEPENEPKELSYAQKIKVLEAKDLPDPPANTDPSQTTRIQIRSGIDGKRVVKKFNVDDPIVRIFEFVKFAFADSLGGRAFTLKMQRENLGDSLDSDKTILDCQLKNASLLLEVLDEDDEL